MLHELKNNAKQTFFHDYSTYPHSHRFFSHIRDSNIWCFRLFFVPSQSKRITKYVNTMEIKTVGVASDHAGYPLKKFVLEYLEEKGYPYKDYGTWSDASVDYPDFGHALAEGIENGEVYPGIAICGSGEGISMTLNKHQQVRAGLCWIPEVAHLIRQHNDANVLVMPGRFIDNNMARKIMDEFFTATFEGGRHQKRVEKIAIK